MICGVFLSPLLAPAVAARDPVPLWISFTEDELLHAKSTALQAMNSRDVWARFPARSHQPHYTPLRGGISFGFSQERGLNTVTVIVPTTHVGARHRDEVCVTFNQGLKITDIAEAPQI